MSEFPQLDKLHKASANAREKAEKALRDTLAPGAIVAIKSGPEFVGRYQVQEYPDFSYGQLDVKNLESGVVRRVVWQQVKLIE